MNMAEFYDAAPCNLGESDQSLITLMKEAVSTFEASVSFYQTLRRNSPEDSHLLWCIILVFTCHKEVAVITHTNFYHFPAPLSHTSALWNRVKAELSRIIQKQAGSYKLVISLRQFSS
jgi:hypothetical protein